MKAYKQLFFDLDHTIWDFESNAKDALGEAYHYHQMESKGLPEFDLFYERYSLHNKHLWERYTKGFLRQGELKWKRMYLSMLDFKIADEPMARILSDDFLNRLPLRKKVFPYTFEILEYLKSRNYNLHLITNGFNSIQMRKLENAGLQHYFEVMITSESSGSLKPNREIFAYAMAATGAAPEHSIMIGDNLIADIQGAGDFGMDTVFTNHIADTTLHGATYEVRHLKELEAIF